MKYVGPIIVVGLILPLFLIGLVGGVLFAGWAYMSSEVKAREVRYDGYLANTRKIKDLTPKVKARMGELLAIRDMLLSEQPVALNEALRKADEGFVKQSEIRRFAYSSAEREQSVFSGVSLVPFDVINVGYEGKFGAMQTMLLNVETRRKNLFLDSLTITYKEPSPTMGYYQPYESFAARYISITGAPNIVPPSNGAAPASN